MCEIHPECAGPDGLVGHALEHIGRGSWAITGVMGDRHNRPFAYTTGLTSLGYPELVVTAMGPVPAAEVLNSVALQILTEELLGPGSRLPSEGCCGNHALHLLEVTDARTLLVNQTLYEDFDALQVVWSDNKGRFPWHPRCDDEAGQQWFLGPPPRRLRGRVA